ncbi:MAG: hypothetical protein VXW31_07025, partial [Planctomycetota bacterium]|nr:hypothetical protein [Planctomycetota bacterium]
MLWDSVLAPISEDVIPPLIRMELDLVLDGKHDEQTSIPGFLKDLVLEDFAVDTAGAAPFRVSGFRIITDKSVVKKDGDFLMDVGFEVCGWHMRMEVIAVIDNLLSDIINKLTRRDSSQVEVRVHCSDVRMKGTLRVRIRPRARLVFFAFDEAPTCILGMRLTLFDKLTRFKKEVPVTAFPAIPTLLNKVIQLTIADFMVWPRYYLLNLVPPEALGLNPVPTPEIGYINVRVLEATGLELLWPSQGNPKKISPRITYVPGARRDPSIGRSEAFPAETLTLSCTQVPLGHPVADQDGQADRRLRRGLEHLEVAQGGGLLGPDRRRRARRPHLHHAALPEGRQAGAAGEGRVGARGRHALLLERRRGAPEADPGRPAHLDVRGARNRSVGDRRLHRRMDPSGEDQGRRQNPRVDAGRVAGTRPSVGGAG